MKYIAGSLLLALALLASAASFDANKLAKTDASKHLISYAGSACTSQFAKAIGADGTVTCGSASGVGTCAANAFVTALTSDAAPTCTQPSAANLSNGVTGSGAVVLATGPTIGSPTLTTPTLSGHITTAGTVPTMGACGTSPAISGNDNAMLITVGTGGVATSCAVTFAGSWSVAPVCVAQNNTDRVAYSMATSTSALTITATAAFTASSKFHVICHGI